jgi:methionyl-tRNA formyltransferase
VAIKVLFIGGTKRGYMTLSALLETGAEVIGIISLRQDEHETERYEEPIQSLAEKFRIPIYETKWMKDRNWAELIAEDLRPDIAFVIGCRILIPREIYRIPPLGMLGVHDSLLPRYRGFAPTNWAILNGENITGVTLFYLSELMDGGDIVSQKQVRIGPDEAAPAVYERVCRATTDLILETYSLLGQGTVPRTKQDYSQGSFTCARIPADGYIEWSQRTVAIYNQVRALTAPYPGAFTYYKNRPLTVWSARPVDNPRDYVGRIPGRVVGISKSQGHIDVLTGDGTLRIFEIQRDAEDKTAAANVIQSPRATLGLRPVDLLQRIQELEKQVVELTERQGREQD